jgi:hypothetical protein
MLLLSYERKGHPGPRKKLSMSCSKIWPAHQGTSPPILATIAFVYRRAESRAKLGVRRA